MQRILYVEDEPDIQAVAKLALEQVGRFTLEVCSSGQEALDKADAFSPQLILLDVMMPEMDGPTTLKKLREISGLENTPAVFMTARVQPHEVQEYIDMGAVDVIAKPFDPMTLSNQIREIWERVST
ncbi:MAG: response regulator [Sulfuriflexus sp.]|nr:response regulator [Sulfuriflexus sp.]